jgi:putative transcriptional regulator
MLTTCVLDNINSMLHRSVFAVVWAGLICLGSDALSLGQSAGDHLTPGTILVASEKLGDPNFAETVILITRRDADGGTMGVVLNHPTDVTLAKAFPQMHGNSDLVYDGGPVSPDAVQALLRSTAKPETAEHIAGDVYSVVRKALLEKSISEHLPNSKFRVFLGYAGWGPGQLENEVRLGAWTTLRGVKYVFDSDPGSLWERLNRDSHSQVAQDRAAPKATAAR